MAFDGQCIRVSGLFSGADLTAAGNQFKFVKLSAAKTVVLCAAATDIPIGVLQNRPNTGEAAEVVAIGHTKCQADAAVTAGALIGTSADGQADPKVAGTDTTEYIVGRALDAVSNAGEIFSAFIDCAAPARGA